MKLYKALSAFSRADGSRLLVRTASISMLLIAGLSAGTPAPAAAAQKSKTVVESMPVVPPQGPLLVVVSIGSQKLTVYDRNGRVLETPVSSGQTGHETPHGVFSIIERNREHFSNLYNDAPMPNMQRITWSGVAMHAGNLPGYPASHGCIRMPFNVSARMFDMTKLGTRVVVSQGNAVPMAIEHPNLFKQIDTVPLVTIAAVATEPNSTSRTDATTTSPMMLGAATVDSSAQPQLTDPFEGRPAGTSRSAWAAELLNRAQALEVTARNITMRSAAAHKDAKKAMSQALISERARSIQAAKVASLVATIERGGNPAAIEKAEDAKAAAETNLAALVIETDRLRAIHEEKSIVAEELGREAAAAAATREAAFNLVRDANRSMKPVSVFVSRKTGRLYVRQGFQPLFDVPVAIENSAAPIGTHVYTALTETSGTDTMQWSALTVSGAAPETPAPTKRGRNAQPNPASRPGLTPTAALDRITIPDDVRQRIGLLMSPGSSLIVSDNGISQETGKGTDFVILTKEFQSKQAW